MCWKCGKEETLQNKLDCWYDHRFTFSKQKLCPHIEEMQELYGVKNARDVKYPYNPEKNKQTCSEK